MSALGAKNNAKGTFFISLQPLNKGNFTRLKMVQRINIAINGN